MQLSDYKIRKLFLHVRKLQFTIYVQHKESVAISDDVVESSTGADAKRKRTYENDHKSIVITSTNSMSAARAILVSKVNSHAFEDRVLLLDVPAKVGRAHKDDQVSHKKSSSMLDDLLNFQKKIKG